MDDETAKKILGFVKRSIRLTDSDTDEDDLIKLNINAATETVIASVGGNESDDFYKDNMMFIQAVSLLATSQYMNRGANTDVNLEETSHGYQSFILNLKARYTNFIRGGNVNG